MDLKFLFFRGTHKTTAATQNKFNLIIKISNSCLLKSEKKKKRKKERKKKKK